MIIPTILALTFDEFAAQAQRLQETFKLIQIDVMDGQFVDNKSFDEIENINNLNLNVNWELHLMVEHPLVELEKWSGIKNVQRIIFHVESKDDPNIVIAKIRGICAQVGIAVNPETSLSTVVPFYDKIDEVLFMTVHPGRQGGEFLPEIKEKIISCRQTSERLTIAVDGAVKPGNIAEIKSWGVDAFCVGSAITGAADTKIAYQNLLNKLNS